MLCDLINIIFQRSSMTEVICQHGFDMAVVTLDTKKRFGAKKDTVFAVKLLCSMCH